MGTRDLPNIHAQSPRAKGLRDEDIHIRDIWTLIYSYRKPLLATINAIDKRDCSCNKIVSIILNTNKGTLLVFITI